MVRGGLAGQHGEGGRGEGVAGQHGEGGRGGGGRHSWDVLLGQQRFTLKVVDFLPSSSLEGDLGCSDELYSSSQWCPVPSSVCPWHAAAVSWLSGSAT